MLDYIGLVDIRIFELDYNVPDRRTIQQSKEQG